MKRSRSKGHHNKMLKDQPISSLYCITLWERRSTGWCLQHQMKQQEVAVYLSLQLSALSKL